MHQRDNSANGPADGQSGRRHGHELGARRGAGELATADKAAELARRTGPQAAGPAAAGPAATREERLDQSGGRGDGQRGRQRAQFLVSCGDQRLEV
ncbi:MAG: hypothetical protein LC708_01425, partial [Actinobacteria bacterium]|nr:hypothetical protein [Actinomycetota bacterium]